MNKEYLYIFSHKKDFDIFFKDCSGHIPDAILWNDFLRKYFFYGEKKNIPHFLRKILLAEAAQQVDIAPLGFEANFLDFLKNSQFIFPFLEELSYSTFSIEDIQIADTYDEYGEHLNVIQKLKDAYFLLLEQYNFCDSIIQKGTFLKQKIHFYECVEFFLDDLLTPFECDVLHEIATCKPLYIHIHVDRYNKNIFENIMKCTLDEGKYYIIDFKDKTIIHKEQYSKNIYVHAYKFTHAINQVALCFDKIKEWIAQGVDANNIAVILPDESFREALHLFDEYNNFDYIIGWSIQDTEHYKQLKKICNFLGEDKYYSKDPYFIKILDIQTNGVPALEELSEILRERYYEACVLLDDILIPLNMIADILKRHSLKTMLDIALAIITEHWKTECSSNNGKIKVLGIKQVKNFMLDKVIILNMNEGLVPKANEKDLFLNSFIRKKVSLPTHKIREDMQKHYYLSALQSSSEAVIGWVCDEEKRLSHLILEQELDKQIHITNHDGEELYCHSLFVPPKQHQITPVNIVAPLPDDFVFSYTKMKLFLQCPCAFYYLYIQKLDEEKEEYQRNALIGILIHKFLQESYQNAKTFKEVYDTFYHKLKTPQEKQSDFLQLQLIGKYMKNFFMEEENFFMEEEILYLEKKFTCNINGFIFHGFIDRISQKNNGDIILIDYKLKKNIAQQKEQEEASIQFAIYIEAMKNIMDCKNKTIIACIYDLYNGSRIIIDEKLLLKARAILFDTLERFKEKSICFNPQKSPHCSYCSFYDICGLHHISF